MRNHPTACFLIRWFCIAGLLPIAGCGVSAGVTSGFDSSGHTDALEDATGVDLTAPRPSLATQAILFSSGYSIPGSNQPVADVSVDYVLTDLDGDSWMHSVIPNIMLRYRGVGARVGFEWARLNLAGDNRYDTGPLLALTYDWRAGSGMSFIPFVELRYHHLAFESDFGRLDGEQWEFAVGARTSGLFTDLRGTPLERP